MTLAVDASIGVNWFVEEQGCEQVLQIPEQIDRQAPDLMVAEVANAIRKKVVRG